ncbi:Lecithin retinol acyltransferase [Dissostichus eleginoides]|uniref:Lecithin retinol acyltransferase n=1 Tax=Dissostichus eleginoides TaxID=100907 RepID=A0AAD9F654_DISEL|nr:Lecithin retinol acyltransferase [Dissostichus eleginoides]
MLDTLTFLLEKLFLLAHFKVSSLLPPPRRERAGRSEEPPPTRLLQRGDLLEVPRTLFTHFGIYLGEGRVAHLIPDVLPLLGAHPKRVHELVTNTRLVLGVLSKHATVRVDSVEDFAARCPQEEVAARAEKLVGPVSYSLLWNNCEHFVTYTRYGTAQSLQTDKFCEWLKSLIRDQRNILLSALLGLLSMACFGISFFTAPPTLLVPFTLWMVS